MTTERYDHEAIETRWQAVWAAERAFETANPASPGTDERPHSYVLEMLPYPSGDLHMGHVENYTMGDVVSHFGAATATACCTRWATTRSACRPRTPRSATGGHPRDVTRGNIAKIRVADASAWAGRSTGRASSSTAEPEYYRWTQWIFLQLFERGLAYKTHAHGQLVPAGPDGARQRAGHRRPLRALRLGGRDAASLAQWYFKITDYAQRLLDDMEMLETGPSAC